MMPARRVSAATAAAAATLLWLRTIRRANNKGPFIDLLSALCHSNGQLTMVALHIERHICSCRSICFRRL